MAYSTEDFFPVFKEECGKWLNFFNLKNWEVFITLEKVVTPQEDGSSLVDQNLLESRAICRSNRVGKVADIVLHTVSDDSLSITFLTSTFSPPAK